LFSLDTDESKKAFKQLIKIAENNSNDSSTFIGALSNNLLALVQVADYEAYLRQFDENILTTRNYDGMALRIALRNEDDTIKMEYANILFYVYFREWQFRKGDSFPIEVNQFRKKIKEMKSQFSEHTNICFDLYEELPFKILQDEFHSSHAIKLSQAIKATDIEKIDKFMGSYEGVVSRIENWEKELPNTIEKVKNLRDNLEEQKTAFNFVGLYNGFSGLEIQKKKSLFWKRWEYYGLLFLMLLVPSVELYWAITI
jgi:DNA repair exonuclease SbcCD ATPase subunit